MTQIPAADRLIVALDVADRDAATAMVERLGETVRFYKIGMELAYGGGLDLVRWLIAAEKRVFVDLKLHDIPNTVARATARIAELGATFLTVHGYPQTMAAAREGAAGSGLGLLAVTVLTSSDDADLAAAGYALSTRALVARRALQAREAGMRGIILSPSEVAEMRAFVGPDLLLVTPGVRPAGAAMGDQKRAMTPGAAIAAGADYLVVGRPILAGADPRGAAQAVVAEIAAHMA
jgi:orotidine-5'-phosphate decarboxylase